MPPEPTLIAFDTSAAHCAAALLLGNRIVTRMDEMAKGQAEHLMPMLDEMLSAEALGWNDLDAIAVGVGPGNFTGIRISVAAARGLALGLGKPAIGVSLLEAQTYELDGALISCLDARRDRIYVQAFGAGTTSPPQLCQMTRDDLTFGFDGYVPRIVGAPAAEVAVLTGYPTVAQPCPSIEAIARLAVTRMSPGNNRPTPLYIRSADAAPPRDPAPVILP